jgi:hypothetical protein
MKLKSLEKKIRRLEARLRAGPRKLARLKRKLDAMSAAKARKAEKSGRSRGRAPDCPVFAGNSKGERETGERKEASCCREGKAKAQPLTRTPSATLGGDESPLGGQEGC